MLHQIGKNIRKERLRLNLKVEYICDKIGVSTDTLYKIENGQRAGESLIKYLLFLNNKNADLNKIFKMKLEGDEK
jgi:transcriptional regulator with XRE-family HTH domain